MMGGINGNYLANITLNAAPETQEVLAAVAYAKHFERNKKGPDTEVAEVISWWRSLSKAPWEENIMLNSTASMVRKALTAEAIEEMGYSDFHEVCMDIHSIKDWQCPLRGSCSMAW